MDRIKELLATLQAKKDPLETRRCALWKELDQMNIEGAPSGGEIIEEEL